jgi:hypothetical protein
MCPAGDPTSVTDTGNRIETRGKRGSREEVQRRNWVAAAESLEGERDQSARAQTSLPRNLPDRVTPLVSNGESGAAVSSTCEHSRPGRRGCEPRTQTAHCSARSRDMLALEYENRYCVSEIGISIARKEALARVLTYRQTLRG